MLLNTVACDASICYRHTRDGLNRPEPDPEHIQLLLRLPSLLNRENQKNIRHVRRNLPYLGDVPKRQDADQRSFQ